MIVSRHYATKMWTRLERQSAQDRALNQEAAYILPVRLDDSELPALHSTISHLDARKVDADKIADTLARKLGTSRSPRYCAGSSARERTSTATMCSGTHRGVAGT